MITTYRSADSHKTSKYFSFHTDLPHTWLCLALRLSAILSTCLLVYYLLPVILVPHNNSTHLMARRGSLDSMFSELLQEANVWAGSDRNVSRTGIMTHVNGRRVEEKEDTAIEECLEQLARAISAHVTDILIERLGLEERIAQTNDSATTKESTKPVSASISPKCETDALRIKQSASRTLSTPRSLPQSPTLCHRSRLPRRIPSNSGMRQPQPQQQPPPPLSRRCSRGRADELLIRYHSENRLNRIEPPPGFNETPLENRASRLRRANAGRKLASRGDSLDLLYESATRNSNT
ncbi:hypothetical protein GCK32_016034 [Trichostrongylus colubriformis]|uniref:Uncharacterized protein n=1 Tax=Trichostrongylus colubriformis TaxID=6319 RepID=A0AAN8IMV5_TRICO